MIAGNIAAACANQSSARQPGSVRTHVVALAHFNAVMAQQRIRRADVEEELRQAVVQQVGLPCDLAFLGRTRAQHDFAGFTTLESRGIQATHEGGRIGNQCAQPGKGLRRCPACSIRRSRNARLHLNDECMRQA